MAKTRNAWLGGLMLVLVGAVVVAGCSNSVVELTDYTRGPAPLRMPSPAADAEGCDCYEDSLTGAKVFEMYCNYCHNAPSLAERPFSNWRNVDAHMHQRANLTGKEYAKLVAWMRRWHDVPGPHPPVEPSPKRFYFGQPIQELRDAPGPNDKAGQQLPPPASAPANVPGPAK
jgi:hypothetical protein